MLVNAGRSNERVSYPEVIITEKKTSTEKTTTRNDLSGQYLFSFLTQKPTPEGKMSSLALEVLSSPKR